MSNCAPGNHRPTLMAAWGKATRFHRRRILTLCEERIYVFSRLVPWPALAESWQADLDLIKRGVL